jgi:hypothetical protein
VRKVLVIGVALIFAGAACQEPTTSPGAEVSALKEGDLAPGFTLESPETEVSLADYRGKKPVLLYFSMGPG